MMLSRLSFLAPTRGPAAAIMRQSLLGSSSVLAVQHQPRTTTRTPSSAAAAPEHPWSSSPQQQQQVRFRRGWAFTKQRLKRQARYERRKDMRERGIPIPKPPMYLPRDTPVVNAQTDEERRAAVQAQDEAAVAELHDKLRASREKELLRFHMTGLRMSERVRKLFDLHNGNQKEVIKAQKQKGMEVFQLREGDTGSSAVQGACVLPCVRKWILLPTNCYCCTFWVVGRLIVVVRLAPQTAALTVLCFGFTSSCSTVIALTTRIQQLQTHMGKHKKDMHNKRNLQRLLTRRRKVLDYMERKEFDSYRRVVKTLGLVRK